jgi:hypothetical protein
VNSRKEKNRKKTFKLSSSLLRAAGEFSFFFGSFLQYEEAKGVSWANANVRQQEAMRFVLMVSFKVGKSKKKKKKRLLCRFVFLKKGEKRSKSRHVLL